jgi:hypothetical protein
MTMTTTRHRVLCALAVAGAALMSAGCGGDQSASPPGSPDNPLVAEQAHQIPGSAPATADGRSNEGAASSGRPTRPGYEQLVAGQKRHPASRFTPCNLVTHAQARAIVGAQMRKPVEAAQGPTCIYRSRDGRSFVTLAVQALDFAKVRPRMRLRRRVAVSDRSGWCGTYGQPVLYVPLAHGRVLTVGGQCAIAKRFAVTALPHLAT